MEFIMKGGNKLDRGFTACDRDFDTNVMKAERQVQSIVEEQVKVKSPAKSEGHFIVGKGKEHRFVRRFSASLFGPSNESRVKVN
jgi:hypothetical protein